MVPLRASVPTVVYESKCRNHVTVRCLPPVHRAKSAPIVTRSVVMLEVVMDGSGAVKMILCVLPGSTQEADGTLNGRYRASRYFKLNTIATMAKTIGQKMLASGPTVPPVSQRGPLNDALRRFWRVVSRYLNTVQERLPPVISQVKADRTP